MKSRIILVPLAIVLFFVYSGLYVVNETEQVVVTQFGRAVGDAKTI